MQDPQLLVPSTIASQASINSLLTSSSAGRAGLGLARLTNSATPYLLRSTSSTRSRKRLPLGKPISSIPIVLPLRLSRRLPSAWAAQHFRSQQDPEDHLS